MASDLPRCTEKTVVITIPLPNGQNWAWLGDCNVLALSPTLNALQREEALVEVGAAWRRSFLRVVGSASEEPEAPVAAQEPTAS